MYGQSAIYTGSYALHSIAVACDSKLKDKKNITEFTFDQ